MYLSFFIAFAENSAAAPPLALKGSVCETATDYTKKKNVLRLKLADGAEYLFMANSPAEMMEWRTKMQFHAGKLNGPVLRKLNIIHNFLLN